MLAGLVKSELQNGSVSFWQRVKGEWKKSEAWRGGYQGKRLITILFCCSLIRAQRRSKERGEQMSHVGEAGLGYQDDNYMAGYMRRLVETWPVKEELEKAGNTVNTTKSGIMCQGWKPSIVKTSRKTSRPS